MISERIKQVTSKFSSNARKIMNLHKLNKLNLGFTKNLTVREEINEFSVNQEMRPDEKSNIVYQF
jgi:hypothetical protein